MAILKGVEVTIHAAGHNLTECPATQDVIEEELNNEATRYVEAQPGVSFEIIVKIIWELRHLNQGMQKCAAISSRSLP